MDDFQEIVLLDEDYLHSLLKDILSAKETIDMAYYIFNDGAVGKMVADALCKAAKNGVKIRVLVDGIGSINWGGQLTDQLEQAGIKTKIFHPLPWKMMHWSRSNYASRFLIPMLFHLVAKINSRNHRKICMIDNKIIYAGSANITDHLLSHDVSEKCWRETNIKLENINFDIVRYAFDKTWNPLQWSKRFRLSRARRTEKIFHLNDTWRSRHRFYKTILNNIMQSQKRIWVTNAYFVPNNRLLNKLIKASQKGIDVKILLPGKYDVFIVSAASATFYSKLIKNGVKVYEYLPTVLHAKTLIMDDWYSIGSSNFDTRSFIHDLEILVKVSKPESQQILEKQFQKDLTHAKKINYSDINQLPLFKKIIGQLVLLIKYWL